MTAAHIVSCTLRFNLFNEYDRLCTAQEVLTVRIQAVMPGMRDVEDIPGVFALERQDIELCERISAVDEKIRWAT